MGFFPGAQNDIFEEQDDDDTPPTPAPPAVTNLGCYQDTSSPRVLPYAVWVEGGNTPANCAATCKGLGFDIAGVEYMSECWCGNNAPDVGFKVRFSSGRWMGGLLPGWMTANMVGGLD